MSFDVRNRRIVVVGAGRSGRAAARLLQSKGAEVTLTDTDSRALDGASDLRALGVRMEPGAHRSDLLASADLVVLSPGVPPAQPAVEAARRAGVPVIGE